MERMARKGQRLYLLGAKPGVAEAAAARLEVRYPGLTICGVHDGYFQEDGPVVEDIRKAGADVVFVCLGFPKQEYWMVKNGPATGARLLAGLGGKPGCLCRRGGAGSGVLAAAGAGVALPADPGAQAHRTHGPAAAVSGGGPGGAGKGEEADMKGSLIVLEGTDGSGKSTQFSRLCRRMEEAGAPFHRIVFPQYQEPSSALVRMYLGGEFGSRPSDVNPYAASTFYAVDRYASYKKVWGGGLPGGKADPLRPLHHLQRRPPDRQAAGGGVGGLSAVALRL